MKKILTCSIFVLVFLIILTGCQNKQNMTGPEASSQVMNQKNSTDVKSTDYPLYASKDMQVGKMSVSNGKYYLIVTYSLNKGWNLKQTYLHIATSLNGIPQVKIGTPIIGKFDYIMQHDRLTTEYTYNIPLSDNMFRVGDPIFIAAYASIIKSTAENGTSQQYTAWGGDIRGPGPRWWYYIKYMLDDYHHDPDFPDHQSDL